MRTIHHMHGDARDDALAARLFDLALRGDTDSAELNAVQSAVYAGLEETYGHDEVSPRPRTRQAA